MNTKKTKNSVCMLLFSHFESDARPRREAISLREQGFQVYCISLGKKNEKKVTINNDIVLIKKLKWIENLPQGSFIRYIISFTIFVIVCFFELLRLASKGIRFDVIHIHNPPDHLVFAALPFKLFFKTKIILDRHEPFALQIISNLNKSTNGVLYKILRIYEKFSYKFVDLIFVVNKIEYTDVNDLMKNKKIRIVRNSFDKQRLRVDNEKKPFNADYETYTVLYQGFISKRRDIDTIIHAIKILKDKIPKIRCVIIGDGDYLEEAKIESEKLGLKSTINFYRWMNQNELFELIRKANLCLVTLKDIPVYHRATPNKLFEYMNFKKPIIVADLPSLRDLSQGVCLFYNSEDPQCLADKILFVYNKPSKISKLIQKMDVVLEKNLWQIDEQVLISAYNEIISI